MQNVTVRFSLMSALALFSLMILVGAGVGVYSLGRANDSTTLVYQASASSMAINDAYKDTTRTRSAFVRAYNALKDGGDQALKTSAVQTGQKTYERTIKATEQFQQAPAFPGQDAATKAELVANAQALSAGLNRAMTALNNNDADAYAAINTKDLTAAGAAFSVSLEKYQSQIKELADNTVAERQKEYHLVLWLVVAGVLAAAAVVVAVHFLLRSIVLTPLNEAVDLLEQVAHGDLTMRIRAAGSNEIGRLFAGLRNMQQGLLETVTQVRTGSDIINTGAQEIAAGNMDLSSRTETQASSLEETAASMEELTGTVRQNAENARQANALVQAASLTAVKGGEVMGQMVGTMSAINESSRKIVDIISVIDGIAFQTNILALNAAVEAARAGEQGRGFAVVASEVRNLAQRSAAAAKEIKGLIDDSVVNVDNGSKLVEQAGLTMTEVVHSVQRVTDIVSEIAEASREQSDGIEQVNQAITQMDEVTQQNAALVEEAAAATQSLQSQATALAATVGTFKIDASQVVAVAAPVQDGLPTTRPTTRPAARPAAQRSALRSPALATRATTSATSTPVSSAHEAATHEAHAPHASYVAPPVSKAAPAASTSGLSSAKKNNAKSGADEWEEF